MIILALLAAVTPQTAVDAERAFAARAQTQGMWTAFRATAADDAVIFTPQPVNAQQWLKDRRDPRIAYSWWPAEAYVSCDGNTAAITGPSVRGAYRGYFTSIWQRQTSGEWKWVLDHGDKLKTPRPAGDDPLIRRSHCPVAAPGQLFIPKPYTDGQGMPVFRNGTSTDKSLAWHWVVDLSGERTLRVSIWDGLEYRTVITDQASP